MDIENRATKIYLKNLPPRTAHKFIDEYKIPNPYKEILITACVDRKEGFAGIRHLEKEYNINITYRTFGRKLREALEMFRESHKRFYKG